MTAADWRAVVVTDLTSVFACTQAAAEIKRAQPGGGTVTHIASIEAGHPAPGHAHYSTAKAAVVRPAPHQPVASTNPQIPPLADPADPAGKMSTTAFSAVRPGNACFRPRSG